MGSYTVKTIIDYINGEDLDNIEELEDNYLFMIDVIKYTKDKKIYNLCSDDIKSNYYFVKFLINKFKDDIYFICLVVDNYLKRCKENNEEKIELLILASDLVGMKNIDKFSKYKIIVEMIYTQDRMEVEFVKKMEKDDVGFGNQTGMGFVYFFDKYSDSKIVLNFYASKLIEEIFDENNLEKTIHENFNNFEELEKMGFNNFLLSFISEYDEFLSDYVSINIYLIDDLKSKFLNIKENWDRYNKLFILTKCDIISERVMKYLDDAKSMFSIFDVLCLFANEFNLKDVFCDLGYLEGDDFSDDILEMTKEELGLVHYQNIRNIFLEILQSKKIEEIDYYLEDNVFDKKGCIKVLKKEN